MSEFPNSWMTPFLFDSYLHFDIPPFIFAARVLKRNAVPLAAEVEKRMQFPARAFVLAVMLSVYRRYMSVAHECYQY